MRCNLSKITLSIVVLFLMLVASIGAEAKARIPVGEIESLTKVADLPDTDDYKIKDKEYADIGILYNVFTIAIVPLWITKEPVLVAYNEKDDTYVNLPDAEMDALLKKENLKKDELLNPGFYVRYGGKLIALLVLALIIYGILPSKKEKKEVLPKQI